MKKNQYIAPAIEVTALSVATGILLSGSGDGQQMLGNGGTTTNGNVTYSDVKADRDSYNVWDDDWSR
jgi:hypothetical protein